MDRSTQATLSTYNTWIQLSPLQKIWGRGASSRPVSRGSGVSGQVHSRQVVRSPAMQRCALVWRDKLPWQASLGYHI